MKIKENILIISMIWIGLIALSFSWNYVKAVENLEKTALQGARGFFDQILITRQWNARHGGLYARITPTTQPNPYLAEAQRDLRADGGLQLTKINPAFMTRQISEIAMERRGIQFHITSLNPIRPENAATPREALALRQFAQGTKEVASFITENGTTAFFYMAPLVTQQACLSCHAAQGYREGDIRGGISVTLPFSKTIPFAALIIGHVAIALIGLVGIAFAGRRLHQAYETIRIQAVLDALTGIANRRSFSERILRECRRSIRAREPLSIILCDIDHFKAYNDTYGHTSGDLCLIKIAKTIKLSLRRPTDFCARYGGEEFVVILPNTSRSGALHVAERIRQNIVDLAITHKQSSPLEVVSLSLGVATSTDTDLVSHEDLIRYADKALYQAKDRGRNRVVAYDEN
jgi:diguanylate cyclase (GGDEF)-like protein